MEVKADEVNSMFKTQKFGEFRLTVRDDILYGDVSQ